MSDRFIKFVTRLFDEHVVDDNQPHYSAPENVYDTPVCGLLIGLDRVGAPTTLDISVEFSPDQGQHWYLLDDGIPGGGPTVFPANTAYGNISCPSGLARVRILATGCDAANYYTATVWFSKYRN